MQPSARRVSVIAQGAMRERGQAFLLIQEDQLSSQSPAVFVEPNGFVCGCMAFH